MNRETCKSEASNYWLCHAKHPSSDDFPSSDEWLEDRIPSLGNSTPDALPGPVTG